MRLALDITALHSAPTGVGAFTREVLQGVAAEPDIDVVAYSVSWRGRGDVAGLLPPSVTPARGPMAAQPLRWAWRRFAVPPIELWTGAIDVVHGPNFVVPPARHAAALVTVHDLTFERYPELCTADVLQYPGLIRRALARGAHVHAVSSFVADEVIATYGAPADRVHVVPNGVTRADGGDAAAGARHAGGERYVLALGTIEPRKDHPSLVAAFDRLAADDPDLRLVIAGPDGWGLDAFDAAVASAAHRDRVVRFGWVDERIRSDLLAGAAVFAYPSLYEGFGLPPLEAMSAGTPVVATRAGAIPEVTGDAALLVAPRDVDALAGALERVLTDASLAASLVARGREQAARYSWASTATALAGVYRTLC